mmetsp:Transcript_81723/g.196017  ORF Transcript_81723/g.196017 Transcript_81723/m.196017 type:complete len:508 (-) Transcript_81723:32-1555(-)
MNLHIFGLRLCDGVLVPMLLHDIVAEGIPQTELLEVVGILHFHVEGLILHNHHRPAAKLEEVIGYVALPGGGHHAHQLAVQLPGLRRVHQQPPHPQAAVRAAALHPVHVLRHHLAIGEVVVGEVLRHETVGIPRQGAVHVPEDARLGSAAYGAARGIEPTDALEAHGASCLKASLEHRALPVVHHRQARHEKVLVVLGGPDANAAPRVGCLGIDVAHQDEVVVQGRRVKPVGQMVHEVPGAALHEAVVVVEDVPGAVVEHPGAAPECRERQEVVQRGWGVGRLQVPPEPRGVHRVVEEGEVRLLPRNPFNFLQAPATVTIGRHVVPVPALEARQPEARWGHVVHQQQGMLQRVHCEVVEHVHKDLVTRLREIGMALGLQRHVVQHLSIVRGVHHHRSLEGVVVGVVAQIGHVHHVHRAVWGQVVPMRGVAPEVCRLAAAGELRVLHPHDATMEGAHVHPKEERIARVERLLVPLHLHVAGQPSHSGAQVGGAGELVVEVPNAQVLEA